MGSQVPVRTLASRTVACFGRGPAVVNHAQERPFPVTASKVLQKLMAASVGKGARYVCLDAWRYAPPSALICLHAALSLLVEAL